MRNTFVLLITILFFSFGCTDFDDKLNVQIRVQNSTEKLLTKVSIDMLEYNDIATGTKSAYKVKEDFLSPSLVEAEADSLKRAIVIDFLVPDTLLPGRYTYKINGLSELDGLEFEVIED